MEVCAVYIFPLILYQLSVFPLPEGSQQAFATISCYVTMARPKADGLQTGLLSMSPQW